MVVKVLLSANVVLETRSGKKYRSYPTFGTKKGIRIHNMGREVVKSLSRPITIHMEALVRRVALTRGMTRLIDRDSDVPQLGLPTCGC